MKTLPSQMLKFPMVTLHQLVSMLELNGVAVSTPSETRPHAVHAGLSVLQRHYQTDSVSRRAPMSSSHPRIWSLATNQTWVAMEATSQTHGHTSPTLVLSLMLATHTPQARLVSLALALENALALDHGPSTTALQAPQLLPEQLLLFRTKLNPTVLWRLHSTCMLIS